MSIPLFYKREIGADELCAPLLFHPTTLKIIQNLHKTDLEYIEYIKELLPKQVIATKNQ